MRRFRFLPVILFLLGLPTAARGQVMVLANQSLEFGQLTPGVQMAVAPTDGVRRAAFSIETNGSYNIRFTLPTSMSNGSGGSIPVQFRTTDGRLQTWLRNVTFNPNTGVNHTVWFLEPRVDVYLGGVAQPAVNVPAGAYTATITIMVTAN